MPPNGTKNLIPLNKKTKEEQKRITTMGGVMSGQKRKAKKDLKERIKLGFEIFTELKAKQLEKDGKKEIALITKELGFEIFTMLDIANNEDTKNETKLMAVNSLIDRVDGKPIQKSLVDANIVTKEMTDKDIELIERELNKRAKKEAKNLLNKN